MATIPTRSMRWATDGAADLVDPPGGKRDVGWVDAEEPAAEYFNELMRAAYDWQQFFITESLQRDGTVPLTGTLTPNTTNTRLIGASTSLQFENVFTRKVTADNAPRARACFSITGGSVSAGSRLFNIGGLSFPGGNIITVTLGSEFTAFGAGTDYGVMMEPAGLDLGWFITGKTATQFSLNLFNSATSAILDLATETRFIAFTVAGHE